MLLLSIVGIIVVVFALATRDYPLNHFVLFVVPYLALLLGVAVVAAAAISMTGKWHPMSFYLTLDPRANCWLIESFIMKGDL